MAKRGRKSKADQESMGKAENGGQDQVSQEQVSQEQMSEMMWREDVLLSEEIAKLTEGIRRADPSLSEVFEFLNDVACGFGNEEAQAKLAAILRGVLLFVMDVKLAQGMDDLNQARRLSRLIKDEQKRDFKAWKDAKDDGKEKA